MYVYQSLSPYRVQEDHDRLPSPPNFVEELRMTPLQIRIIFGDEDKNILHHIDALSILRTLSSTDKRTIELLWDRLDQLTR